MLSGDDKKAEAARRRGQGGPNFFLGKVVHRRTIAKECERSRKCGVAIVFVAMLLAAPAWPHAADISAGRLLSDWNAGDGGTRMLAEVIASAFASGLSWSAAPAKRKSIVRRPISRGGGHDRL